MRHAEVYSILSRPRSGSGNFRPVLCTKLCRCASLPTYLVPGDQILSGIVRHYTDSVIMTIFFEYMLLYSRELGSLLSANKSQLLRTRINIANNIASNIFIANCLAV